MHSCMRDDLCCYLTQIYITCLCQPELQSSVLERRGDFSAHDRLSLYSQQAVYVSGWMERFYQDLPRGADVHNFALQKADAYWPPTTDFGEGKPMITRTSCPDDQSYEADMSHCQLPHI